jgi:stage III sporulation protein AG
MENPVWNKIKLLFFEPKPEESGAKNPPPPKGKLNFLHWVMLLACVGLAAMILHNFFSIQSEVRPMMSLSSELVETEEVLGTSRSSPSSMDEYEVMYENQLSEILSKIMGVGEVSVMVNLDTSEQLVIEKNKKSSLSTTNEKDREGGSRQIEDQTHDDQVVVVRKGNDEEPVVIMTKKPKVRGVLIVAKGAEHQQVKEMITQAVRRVLDVPLHKISVLPKR